MLLLGGWGQQPGHTVFSGVEGVSEHEARLALQAFPFCVRQSDFQSSVRSSLLSSSVQTILLLSPSPLLMHPSQKSVKKGLRLLGLTLSQEKLCPFITVNSSPEAYDSQVLGRGHFVPGPCQARGRCSPGVLERQCGHWGHMVLNPGQLMTCAGSRPTTLPILAQEA